jgi:hypothetical protein
MFSPASSASLIILTMTGASMPPQLLQLLPPLPAGLEYRFIDCDLILWDPHANLIIDFIPHALSLWDES